MRSDPCIVVPPHARARELPYTNPIDTGLPNGQTYDDQTTEHMAKTAESMRKKKVTKRSLPTATGAGANVPLNLAPIALFRRLYQIATAASAEALASDDLIPLEYGVLLRVEANPGIDQNTLGHLLALDRTTISSVVFKLEQRGLIERAINDED